jgi:hypothetical protein
MSADKRQMDAPHVHQFAVRSAEVGRRLGPAALLVAVGGFTVWLAALHSAPDFAAAGWALGAVGVVLGLMAAVAGGFGLLAHERPSGTVRGLVTGALAIALPTLVAALTLVALSQS